MPDQQTQFHVTYGGWYQRTTLHLSEVYSLLALGKTDFPELAEKTAEFHRHFNFTSVTREAGYLEYVRAETADGISIRYYEDGLYVLELVTPTISEGQKKLETYFETIFGPAIKHIFSLGAPTPRELANIKTKHPTVVTTTETDPAAFEVDRAIFGEVYSKISTNDVTVNKTPDYILIITTPDFSNHARDLVEMQIFFREFKDQLEKYLNIHRKIWQEISLIKDHRSLTGKEAEPIRARLDSYQKTISLISNRINQMGSYVTTRTSIATSLDIEEHLRTLFQYKFEALTDTLDYIKEIWNMTSDYVQSGIQMISDILSQSTSRGIESLQMISAIGVTSGILGYLSSTEVPRMTIIGICYFFGIIAVTWILNQIITRLYNKRRYALDVTERATDL
jgi:hypothetical protein